MKLQLDKHNGEKRETCKEENILLEKREILGEKANPRKKVSPKKVAEKYENQVDNWE